MKQRTTYNGRVRVCPYQHNIEQAITLPLLRKTRIELTGLFMQLACRCYYRYLSKLYTLTKAIQEAKRFKAVC